MSPNELKSLMARTRTSSPILAEALGIAPQQIRKWRSGTRPVPEHHLPAIRILFRDRAESLGLEPQSLPEIPEPVDPRQIVPAPIEHRIAIEPRDDPRPPADGATLVEAINSLVAMLVPRRRADPMPRAVPAPTVRPQPLSLFRRDDHGQPARPIARPPAAQPHIIEGMPLGPPPEPFSAPTGTRCRWPHTNTPGAPSGPCEQLAAPGVPYCALHWVQHLRQRQRFGLTPGLRRCWAFQGGDLTGGGSRDGERASHDFLNRRSQVRVLPGTHFFRYLA